MAKSTAYHDIIPDGTLTFSDILEMPRGCAPMTRMLMRLLVTSGKHPYVAMTGRTPVRVTGAVTKGQRLVTSNVKGCARAVATGETISPFNVIGRALESSTDAGIKLVNCAVRTNN